MNGTYPLRPTTRSVSFPDNRFVQFCLGRNLPHFGAKPHTAFQGFPPVRGAGSEKVQFAIHGVEERLVVSLVLLRLDGAGLDFCQCQPPRLQLEDRENLLADGTLVRAGGNECV